MRRIITALGTLALAGGMLVSAPATSHAVADNGSKSCSTAKGRLRATDSWGKNVTTTLHQVSLTREATVPVKRAPDYKYTLWSVKNSRNAPVSHSYGLWKFQVKRKAPVNVTVTWRAKKPYTVSQYQYVSCTIAVN